MNADLKTGYLTVKFDQKCSVTKGNTECHVVESNIIFSLCNVVAILF
jgi:hypothetical protein